MSKSNYKQKKKQNLYEKKLAARQGILDKYIKKLPKTELHVHLDGTLEPEFMKNTFDRNYNEDPENNNYLNKNFKFPYKDVQAVKDAYKFKDLGAFLDLYFLGAGVMKTQQDFEDLTFAYLKKAHENGVTYAEMFVGPQTHTMRKEGITTETVLTGTINAILRAEKELGIKSNLVLDFQRDLYNDSKKAAKEGEKLLQEIVNVDKNGGVFVRKPITNSNSLVEGTRVKIKDYIVGVGLDYREAGFPPEDFEELFKKARKALDCEATCHAGEAAPKGEEAEYITQALDKLKVMRIDHGNQCVKDEAMKKRIVESQIPLTMCPISNFKLAHTAFNKNEIIELYKAGAVVVVDSDDPAFFKNPKTGEGYINENYRVLVEAFPELGPDDLYNFARNSIEATFLPRKEKQVMLDRLEAYDQQFRKENAEALQGIKSLRSKITGAARNLYNPDYTKWMDEYDKVTTEKDLEVNVLAGLLEKLQDIDGVDYKPNILVDLGSGSGQLFGRMMKQGKGSLNVSNYYGVDNNKDAVKNAENELKDYNSEVNVDMKFGDCFDPAAWPKTTQEVDNNNKENQNTPISNDNGQPIKADLALCSHVGYFAGNRLGGFLDNATKNLSKNGLFILVHDGKSDVKDMYQKYSSGDCDNSVAEKVSEHFKKLNHEVINVRFKSEFTFPKLSEEQWQQIAKCPTDYNDSDKDVQETRNLLGFTAQRSLRDIAKDGDFDNFLKDVRERLNKQDNKLFIEDICQIVVSKECDKDFSDAVKQAAAEIEKTMPQVEKVNAELENVNAIKSSAIQR